MDKMLWPSGHRGEIAAAIDPYTDLVSHEYPPGQRERYTETGWKKWLAHVSGVAVHPGLDFHDIGCVKRYGAKTHEPCECERRAAHNTRHEPGT